MNPPRPAPAAPRRFDAANSGPRPAPREVSNSATASHPSDDPPEWRIEPRILVVDDEPSVVDVFQEFLSAQGYELHIAGTGEEALKMIPEVGPDVILTDLNLPGLSGLDVIRHARSVDPDAVVIVVTGYASASTAIGALRHGAYDYITKPFDLDEVSQIVERGLATRRLKATNRQLVQELQEKNQILEHHEHQLRDRVRFATQQMTTLYEVGKKISTNLELKPRLYLICQHAAEFSGARAAVLLLETRDGDGMYPAASFGVELDPRDELTPQLIDPQGLLGRAARDRRPVHENAGEGHAFSLEGVSGSQFQSLLAIPMLEEDTSIGVLVTLDKPGGFSEEDESFLALFASQAAIAVRNSQLFEHTKSLDRLKSEFVAVVSHEIRTPLTSIKGAVELLSDTRYFSNNAQQVKLLTIAHANTERLLMLINDILDFSKLESSSLSMNLEAQRLEPVVEQAAHSLRGMLDEARIHLEMVLAPDLPDLMMDAHRITQVLTNLLSNAIKFSSPGSRIEICATHWEGGVRVSVRDHGEGIAGPDLPKLFHKFSQVDSSATRKAGGTGLGLVICKGIVEQHDGKIWVESTLGEGSTFHFTLQATEQPARQVA